MSTKSVVVPLPVLMMVEKKYAELVDVLDQLEVWMREIYSKAGMCDPADPDHFPPGPPVAAPSRPDQPSSHVPPVPEIDDPLANVKVPCSGDQLTRVRLAGAKDLVQDVTLLRTDWTTSIYLELWTGTVKQPSHYKLKFANLCWQTQVGVCE